MPTLFEIKKTKWFFIRNLVLLFSALGVGVYFELRQEPPRSKSKKMNNEAKLGEKIFLDSFIFNLVGDQGRRIVKVNMELEVESKKVSREIKKRKSQVRDIIVFLFSGRNYNYVISSDGREFLAKKIRSTINAFLKEGKVKGVHYTGLVYN